MGVNHLWSILEPARKKENLSALSKKTLCVDLSGWICEANCAKGLKHNVSKPHLRNLFFRLLHLTRLGVKLVFVVDGKPPELKWEAIAKRIQARNGGQFLKGKNIAKAGSGARVGRSHFAVWVRECCTLLHLLGVPCLESKGEAEALCAWLDLHQIVDGCITNDGDAFLYGARTVYRDLCISGKDASVECYKMEEIEAKLDLNRQKLVALGILLGCDYLPQGVPGVGKEIAMRLMKSVNQDNLIDRFYEWTKGIDLDDNISSVEKSVRSKALKDKNFPHPEVIEEFLTPKVVPQQVSLKIFNPDLQGLQEFCLKHLEWPEEYTREKVLLLITYWQMTTLLHHYTTTLVQPERIVKARVQQKIECYEVEWQNIDLGEACPTSFVTIETRELFAQAYPELVEEFNENEATKLSKKSKRKKAAKLPSASDDYENEVEFLSTQLEDLRVHHSSAKCHSSSTQNKKQDSSVTIYDTSYDDSLQDIIDSILPSANDEPPSCSLENSCPFEKMGDVNRNFSAVAIGRQNSVDDVYSDDDDDDYEDVFIDVGGDDNYVAAADNDDDDNDDIAWNFKPLLMDVGDNLDSGREFESYKGSQKHLNLNDVETTLDLQDVLKYINMDDYHDNEESKKNVKLTECPPTSFEQKELGKLEANPSTESKVVSKFSNDSNAHKKNPPCTQKQRAKARAKPVLSNADIIEIFGSSDEEDDDNSLFKLKQSLCTTNLKGGTKGTRLADLKSTKQVPDDISDSSNATKCTQRQLQNIKAENCWEVTSSSKGRLSSDLQEVSCVKLNVRSSKINEDVNVPLKGAKRHEEELLSATRKVLEPATTILNKPSRSSVQWCDSQKTKHCDSVDEICSYKSFVKSQGDKSLKENADSPFDDYMPAPLLKRLGKQFSAKQRLASLHSISSAADDI